MKYDKSLKLWTVVGEQGAISRVHLDASTRRLYATDGRALIVAPAVELDTLETSGPISTPALKAGKGRLVVEEKGTKTTEGTTYPRDQDLGEYPDIRRIEQEFASDEVKGELLLNGNHLMALLSAMGFSASMKPLGAAHWVKVQVGDAGRPMKIVSDYKGVKAYLCPLK